MTKRNRPGKKRRDKPVSLRCFVGISFESVTLLQGLLDELKQLAEAPVASLRIAPAENLHITLKYLGPVPDTQLSAIDSSIKQIAGRHKSLALACQGIGFFKNSIWVGIADSEPLTALASDLDLAFAAQGFIQEVKTYIPHVTVARFGQDTKLKLTELTEKYRTTDWGSLDVDSIQLYRSETLPEGARYSILENYSLTRD